MYYSAAYHSATEHFATYHSANYHTAMFGMAIRGNAKYLVTILFHFVLQSLEPKYALELVYLGVY